MSEVEGYGEQMVCDMDLSYRLTLIEKSEKCYSMQVVVLAKILLYFSISCTVLRRRNAIL